MVNEVQSFEPNQPYKYFDPPIIEVEGIPASAEVCARLDRNSQIVLHQRLPSEIFALIFSLVDYEPYRHFCTRTQFGGARERPRSAETSLVSWIEWTPRTPFNVSRVCQHWREITLSSPELWRELVVDTQKKNPSKMAEFWFNHAKVIPVKVTIWREERAGEREGVLRRIMGSVVAVLGSRLHQVAALRICCQSEPYGYGTAAQDMTTVFGALKTIARQRATQLPKALIVDSMDVDLQTTMFSPLLPTFPHQFARDLNELHIRGFFASNLFLNPFPFGLTTLKLDGPPEPDKSRPAQPMNFINIPELLLSLPQLTYLRMKGRYPIAASGSQQLGSLIHLPYLRNLTIGGHHCASYLPFLVTPALESFKLKGDHHWVNENFFGRALRWSNIRRPVVTFIDRNGGTIASMALGRVGRTMDWDALNVWWDGMNRLKHMTITQEGEGLQCPLGFQARENWKLSPSLSTLEWVLNESL